MKGWMKLCLSLGVACALLGGAVGGVGYALGGGSVAVSFSQGFHVDVFPWRGSGETVESREVLSPFTVIDAELDQGELNIVQGTQYAISISKPERIRVEYEVKNGILTLKSPNAVSIVLGSLGKCSVTVTVPAGARLEWVEAETSLGALSVRDIAAEELELSSDMGDVTAEQVTARYLSMTSNMGRVSAAGIRASELELDADMGSIEGDGLTVTEHLRFDCAMGNVSLSGSFADVSGDCDMGSIVLNMDGAEEDYNYDLSCDMGTINLNGDKLGKEFSRDRGARFDLDLNANMGNIEVVLLERTAMREQFAQEEDVWEQPVQEVTITSVAQG